MNAKQAQAIKAYREAIREARREARAELDARELSGDLVIRWSVAR